MAKLLIPLSDEARLILFKFSQETAPVGSAMRKPGEQSVEVDAEIIARLDALRFPGETYSDVIVRTYSTRSGAN